MAMQNQLLTTNRKALTINLDPARYGTFAEIGAGQETARYFFQAGASAGTIAKSISAYDMKFSDEIYGRSESGRYVSEDRLIRMLDYEFTLLNQRLAEPRGQSTTFFVFANTVAAKSYRGTHDCHGWLGVRFQAEPLAPPSNIVIHVRMLDLENVQQQHALGIIGVNLIYAAFFLRENPSGIIHSLLDNLTRERIEVDMIRMSGPGFEQINNRLMSLELVRQGLTDAIMFSPAADVIQPSEVLYKKAVFVERGSFRPINAVNLDMIKAGLAEFRTEPEVRGEQVVTLMEMTMNNILTGGEIDPVDFLARVDMLCQLGFNVLISNYPEFYRLATYFRRYTKAMVGIVMGVNNLVEIFNEKYYENLDGGILESFGRLFRNTVKLYVYPMRRDLLEQSITLEQSMGERRNPAPADLEPHELVTADNIQVFPHLRHLYAHLRENHYVVPLEGYDASLLDSFPANLPHRIKTDSGDWENHVPAEVARRIRDQKLFGFHGGA